MLTRQGWLLSGLAVALLVVGRILGTLELYAARRHGRRAGARHRRVHRAVPRCASRSTASCTRPGSTPARRAGSTCASRTRAPRRTPVLGLRDPVSGTRGANLLVGPLDPGGVVRAAYRLPTERRGILEIGPLDGHLADPFGLTEVTMRRVGRLRAHRLPPRRRHRPHPPDRGQRPDVGRRAPQRPRPIGRGLLRAAPLRGRRRPAPGALALDRPPRRAHGPPGRAALAGPGHRRCSTSGPPTTPTASLELVISAAASIVTASARARTSCGSSPPTAPTRASPPATPTSRRSWSTWPASRPSHDAAFRRVARPGRPVVHRRRAHRDRRRHRRRRARHRSPSCATASAR